MKKWLGRILHWLFGWKIEGEYPGHNYDKLIFIVMPHTSNWDFPLGLTTKWRLGMKINFMAKHTLFKKPWGWFFRWVGGIPVIRSKSQNYVESIADAFKREKHLQLVIPAEGTRGKVDKIKTGFYYIAKMADVPLAFIKINYKLKTLFFSDAYHLTGDFDKDMAYINDYFKDGYGKHPELGYLWKGEEKAST